MVNTDIHNSNKAIYCIAAAANSASAVAFGGADRAWRLWDRRQSRKEDMVTSLAEFPHHCFDVMCARYSLVYRQAADSMHFQQK